MIGPVIAALIFIAFYGGMILIGSIITAPLIEAMTDDEYREYMIAMHNFNQRQGML